MRKIIIVSNWMDGTMAFSNLQKAIEYLDSKGCEKRYSYASLTKLLNERQYALVYYNSPVIGQKEYKIERLVIN